MVTLTYNGNAIVSLDATAEQLANLSPLMTVIAARLHQDTLRNFQTSGAFFPGPVWKVSKRVEKKGGKTLIKNSILRNSIHAESGADYAKVGTDLVYAAIHQFGGPITIPARHQVLAFNAAGLFLSHKKAATWKRKSIKIWAGKIGAHTIQMPARPFLPVDAAGNLSPETVAFIQDQAGKFLAGGKS